MRPFQKRKQPQKLPPVDRGAKGGRFPAATEPWSAAAHMTYLMSYVLGDTRLRRMALLAFLAPWLIGCELLQPRDDCEIACAIKCKEIGTDETLETVPKGWKEAVCASRKQD